MTRKRRTNKKKRSNKNLFIVGVIVVVGIVIGVMASSYTTKDSIASLGDITVYKSPTCRCCSKWARYLEKEGFKVKTIDTNQVDQIKKELGVPEDASSCHTGVIDGYAIEGHVPADLITKLITEKPTDIIGIAAPGMPKSSPGMDDGSKKEPYKIVTIDSKGEINIYARR